MAYRSLEVGLKEDNMPHITLPEQEGVDFKAIDIIIPSLVESGDTPSLDVEEVMARQRESSEYKLGEELDETIKVSCGKGPELCAGKGRIDFAKKFHDHLEKFVVGASVTCENADCPLNEPPHSNDNEPLNPTPTPPSLVAHAEQTEITN